MWPSHPLPTLWGIPLPPVEKLWLFALVLARISGLVTAAPLFSAVYLPIKFRAFFAIAFSLVILPTQWHLAPPQAMGVVDVGLLLASQWLVGVVLGIGFGVIFGSLQLAGEAIARTAGLMLADIFDPLSNTEISPLAQLCAWLATATLLVSGSYRLLIEAVLESFVYLPATGVIPAERYWTGLTAVLSESFVCGLRLAAPLLVALLACTLILGFVARTFPQLNVLAVGLTLNGLLTIIGVGLALGGMIWFFAEELAVWQETALTDLLPAITP